MFPNDSNSDENGPREISASEYGRRLMRLPVKMRLEKILEQPDAESAMASLEPQDFFLCVQEIGPEDSLPFLAQASVRQLNHLFDMEWWEKDRIKPAKALEWLERLAGASGERFLNWIKGADFELLTTLLKKAIRVSIAPDDVDLLEARDRLPRNTIDDTYFWDAVYPQYEDFIKQFLGFLFETHQGYYRELMNAVLSAVDDEIEEDAYRFHKGRLEDLAVPDFYDALEIYRPLRAEDILPAGHVAREKSRESSSPSFAVALIQKDDLLSRALERVEDPDLLDMLQFELAALANKVIVADQLAVDNAESFRRAVLKTAAYINLGLDVRSVGRMKAAERLIREVHLEQLFRLGHTQVAGLKKRLSGTVKTGPLSRWPTGLSVLDPEWLRLIEPLLGKTPALIRKTGADDLRPDESLFSTRKDLAYGMRLIDIVEAAGSLLAALNADPELIAPALWSGGQIRGIEDVTLGSMIWTAAVQLKGEGSWEVRPIPYEEWPKIFEIADPDSMERLILERVRRSAPESGRPSTLEAYLAPLFKAYREETAPFYERGTPPEAEMMRFFLFSER